MQALTLSMESLNNDVTYYGHQASYCVDQVLAMESESGEGLLGRMKARISSVFKWVQEMVQRVIKFISDTMGKLLGRVKTPPPKDLPLDPSKAVRPLPDPNSEVHSDVVKVYQTYKVVLHHLDAFVKKIEAYSLKSAYIATRFKGQTSDTKGHHESLNEFDIGSREISYKIIDVIESQRDYGTKVSMIHKFMEDYRALSNKIYGNPDGVKAMEESRRGIIEQFKDRPVDRTRVAGGYHDLHDAFTTAQAQDAIRKALDKFEGNLKALDEDILAIEEGQPHAKEYLAALGLAGEVFRAALASARTYYTEYYGPALDLVTGASTLVDAATAFRVGIEGLQKGMKDESYNVESARFGLAMVKQADDLGIA